MEGEEMEREYPPKCPRCEKSMKPVPREPGETPMTPMNWWCEKCQQHWHEDMTE
jgi:hypothetical protein